MRFLLPALLISIAMAQPGDQAYAKWLNEDVVYIVTPEERAAFQKLKFSVNANVLSNSSGCAAIRLLIPSKTNLSKSIIAGSPRVCLFCDQSPA